MADEQVFGYVAIDPTGRRVRGQVRATSEAAAFERLRLDGLAPMSLKLGRAEKAKKSTRAGLSDQDSAEFLGSLADLLRAGADIRTALSILAARFEKVSVRKACETLGAEIGGGEALDLAFSRAFQKQAFVAPMVAAGEAAGDLPGALSRASEVIQSRLKLRDQLVSVMAYPTFVFVSSIAALLVILLFIVPSIAPLAQEMGGEPPTALRVMMGASQLLQDHGATLLAGSAIAVGVLALMGRLGMLQRPIETILLDGPARRTVGGIVFGAFSLSLGTMLAAGAPIGDALRLATRSVSYQGARRRLEPVANAVRQGEFLSDALAAVKGFPSPIVRLAAVGEASNSVGALLIRSGRMEEEAALKRIEALGRIAGPALIVALGALLGVLMAGLLSGVSQLGQPMLE